jgi:Concanavalin A-like lectin/glucanases superfamily
MPNIVKYNLSTSPNSIQSGNFNIGVNNTPTNLSEFYTGICPIIVGYTIYINKASNGPSIYAPKNDTQLIEITNNLGGNVSTAIEALVWINSQSTMTVLNNNYPSIVTSGLVMNLDAGFVSSYPKTGTTWKDLSGNGYNGTLVNGPTYNTDGGGSISFDGTDDYVSLPINSSFNTSSITFEVWANLSSTPSRQILMVNWQGNSLEVNQDRSVVMYNYSSGGQLGSSTSASIFNWGSWAHFVGVYDNSSQSLKTYINGVLQGTRPNTPSTIYSVGVHKIAGTDYSLGIFGNVATARHYNRALTDNEVLQNYYAGLQRLIPTNGLVLSLDAQNTNLYAVSTTTAYDVSGNNNNGTLTNGTQYVANGDGSWNFDAVDDYIDNIGTTSSFSFIQNTGIFTICAWVRLTEFSTTQRAIMGNNRNVTTEKGFLLARGTASNRIRFVITNGGGNVFSQQWDNYFLDDNWVFVTIVGNGTNVIYYRNGTLFQNGSNLGTLATGDSTRTLSVGRITNLSSSFFWSGNISQTSIYNRALTQTEITTIYNATKSRYGL